LNKRYISAELPIQIKDDMKNFTTFQCLLKLLTKKLVNEGANRYYADHYSKEFKTWEHLLVMLYAQITQAKSLREIELGFNSQFGIRQIINKKKVARSTLSDANKKRPAECFLWIAEQLMSALPRQIRKEVGKVVRLLDSSPIQLKGKGYEWAEAHRTLRCQGLKLHVEYDAHLATPVRVRTSNPNYNDCTMGQNWPLKTDTIYVFDKGYYDFNWWWKINEKKAYFVTRLKNNATLKVIANMEIQDESILEDVTVKFKNKNPRGGKKNLYTEKLRRIVIKRDGDKKPLIIVTNIFFLSAQEIGALYKSRWDVELFFKWIKQNFKIKKFLGTSENAVKLQLAAALISYILTALFRNLFKSELSLQHVLIWIRHNLHVQKANYSANDPPRYSIPGIRTLAEIEGVYL
jgi:putative transposase